MTRADEAGQNQTGVERAVDMFAGPGDARARCRTIEWRATPLGPVEGWSPSLRTAIRICLDSQSPVAVWAGAECTLIHNDAYMAVLGAKANWAMGQPIRVVWNEVWDSIIPDFHRVWAQGDSISYPEAQFCLLRNGVEETAYFKYSLTPIRDEAGGVIGIFNVLDETTSSVKARSAREHHYRALIESIDEGFCVIEAILDEQGRGVDHRFIEVNPAFERHTGLRGAIGRTARELVPDLEPRWPEAYGRIATTGQPERFVDRSEAMGRWFEVEAFRIGPPEDRKVALLFRDITERRLAEEALREADRRKDEFLAVLAHELRNPLAPIRQAAIAALAPDVTPPQARQCLEVIERQSKHMALLLDDLLDLSRITRGQLALELKTIAPNLLMESAVETARPHIDARRQVLEMVTPAPTPALRGDFLRLTQVLSNLLTNAAKFSRAGSTIRFSARRHGNDIEFAVVDQGVGIPADHVRQIFEMFWQVPGSAHWGDRGLGIGLALCRNIIALHEGTIEAHSKGLGFGSTFVVRLPLLPDTIGAPSDPGLEDSGCVGQSRKILVVDDNRDAADSLAMLLRLRGHTVTVINEGNAALHAVETSCPDVVLLDLGMPTMDGFEVARRLRATRADRVPIIVAVTGWGQDEDRRKTREAGFDHHLTKPVDPADLATLIEVSPPRSTHE